jgi:hypothetical protein
MKTFSPVHIHEQIRRAPDIDFSHSAPFGGPYRRGG